MPIVAVYRPTLRADILKQLAKIRTEAATRMFMPAEGVWCLGLILHKDLLNIPSLPIVYKILAPALTQAREDEKNEIIIHNIIIKETLADKYFDVKSASGTSELNKAFIPSGVTPKPKT